MNRKPYSLVILLLLSVRLAAAEKFYSDDPLQNEPRPRNAASVKPRKLNDYYDLVENSFKKRGERNTRATTIRARDVNAVDEPMDGAWYTHRNYWNSMSDEQLRLGPDGKNSSVGNGPVDRGFRQDRGHQSRLCDGRFQRCALLRRSSTPLLIRKWRPGPR